MHLQSGPGAALMRSFRALRKSPHFAIPAILCLALGIGANAAILSVIEQVIVRPLPYPGADALITLGKVTGARRDALIGNVQWEAMLGDDAVALGQHGRTVSEVAFVSVNFQPVEGPAGPEYLEGASASQSLMRTLLVKPALGRWFVSGEDASRVVVLGDAFWRRQFNGANDVVGKSLLIRGEPWTVIGVMPPGLGLPRGAQFWVPLRNTALRGQIVARARAGMTPARIASDAEGLSRSITNARALGDTVHLVATSLHEQQYRPARRSLLLAALAAALILLVACANVANLAVSRAHARAQDTAVRLAIGASRTSLAAMVFSESFLLALGAGLLGILLAHWLTSLLLLVGPDAVIRSGLSGIGWRDGVVTALLTILTAAAISAAPLYVILRQVGTPLSLNASARSGKGRSHALFRAAMVGGQLAVTLVLLASITLLVRSTMSLTTDDRLGFSPGGVVVSTVRLHGPRFRDNAARAEYVRTATERLRRISGVNAVGVGPAPLVAGQDESVREGYNGMFLFEDATRPASEAQTIWIKHVSAEYLSVLRIAPMEGRGFAAADASQPSSVALVNEKAARIFFPDARAIGQTLYAAPGETKPRIIGVIPDIAQRHVMMNVNPELFLLAEQQPVVTSTPTFLTRASLPTAALVSEIRAALREVDPSIPAMRISPLSDVVADSFSRQRFLVAVLTALAGLAVVLSTVGLYGVVSYLVSQRAGEIAVRRALGARTGDVLRMVMRECGVILAIAVAVGVPFAFAAEKVLGSLIVDVRSQDPATLIVITLSLSAIVVVATLSPSRRALSIPPADALRGL